MKVKNLTNKSQTLWVRDLLSGGSLPVEVLANEPREIASNYMPDENLTPKFHETFEILTTHKCSCSCSCESEDSAIIEESEITEGTPEDQETESIEDTPKVPETNESKFICDLCGAEFGSAHGLSIHKTRSHSSE